MSLAIDAATHVQVCTIGDLEVERGRAALIDGQQVALFLLSDGTVPSERRNSATCCPSMRAARPLSTSRSPIVQTLSLIHI